MKKLTALFLCLLLVFSLAACGGGATPTPAPSQAPEATQAPAPAPEATAAPEPPAEPEGGEDTLNIDPSQLTIAVVLKTLSSEYWNYVKAGCEAAKEAYGLKEVIIVGPNAESEIAQQVTMIEEQLAQDIAAIIVAPNEGSAVAAALAPAIGKIPVIAVDSNFELAGKTSFVGTGNEDAAALGGQYIVDTLGSEAKAVIIYGQEGESTSNARTAGYERALTAGNVEILAKQSGNNTTDGAMATMEDLLNRFPDQINAVLCMNDDTAIGAMQACAQNNIEGIKIIGFDGNKSAVDLILTGDIEGTVAQQPYLMGFTAVTVALSALNGDAVEEYVPVPAMLVTSENAQEYLDSLSSMLG